MANSNVLRQEFIEYARNCILSRRPSDRSDFTIGQTAADSYVSFVEVDKLFSYNPEKWKDIKSIFDIDSSERIKEIYLELIGDDEFNKVDCQQTSQYFRSNAIKHYYCFLKAREVVLGKTDSQHTVIEESPKSYLRNGIPSLQQIFYGAPGTGKSHSVKTETKAWEERGRVVRTTFHPDSDYSTFVGAYKPTTESVQRYDIYNKPMTRDGVPVMEQIITYEFVGQAFLQAYIDAWKNREEPEFLIIEEINRGNCAQIFGDLFQLLDRGDDGYSEYAIKADKDLQKHLSKAFKEVEIEDFPNVKAGKELLLPNNLYIRATMNTSDQSLFPIDSAFKRRWDWKYRPISNAQLGWKIEADGMLYDWWEFLERINREIGTTTNSEDKKLGYFFCKAKEGRISAETFVGKVVFYLWNDVFKDYELSNSFFDDGEGGKLTFDKFHTTEGKESKIVEEKVDLFLRNLDLSPIENSATESEIEDEDGNTPETSSRNYDKFTVNDGAECGKNRLAFNCITEYVKLNPGITAQEVYDKWTSLGYIVPHFIETEVQYDSRTDKSKRSESVDCYGTPVYVSCNGYGSNGKADHLMRLVNEKDWGITIKKIEK
ncbi:MAG: AAA family ATPase [Bacteroidales bacterium]|nr:AAA family ATPase [Bacteroidales bacterium]